MLPNIADRSFSSASFTVALCKQSCIHDSTYTTGHEGTRNSTDLQSKNNASSYNSPILANIFIRSLSIGRARERFLASLQADCEQICQILGDRLPNVAKDWQFAQTFSIPDCLTYIFLYVSRSQWLRIFSISYHFVFYIMCWTYYNFFLLSMLILFSRNLDLQDWIISWWRCLLRGREWKRSSATSKATSRTPRKSSMKSDRECSPTSSLALFWEPCERMSYLSENTISQRTMTFFVANGFWVIWEAIWQNGWTEWQQWKMSNTQYLIFGRTSCWKPISTSEDRMHFSLEFKRA